MIKPIMAIASIVLVSAPAFAERTTSPSDHRAWTLARLESRADALRSRQAGHPKLGAVERSALRQQLYEIDQVSAQLRSGQTPDADRVGRLLGDEPRRVQRVDPRDTREVAARLDARAAAVESRLRSAPKLGPMERRRLRTQSDQIHALRRELERDGRVEIAHVEPFLPIEKVRSPAEERAALEIRKATAQRALYGPSKTGAVKRAQIRAEIEALDSMIAELESRR